MRIHISTLFFVRDDLNRPFLEGLLGAATHHLDNYPSDELVITLGDNSNEARVRRSAPDLIGSLSKISRLKLRLIEHPYNVGFGDGHNRAFASDPGDVFIYLNNDLFFPDKSWIAKLVEPLRLSGSTALVGLASAPRLLKPDGNGWFAPPGSKEYDYVDGACVAVRSSVAQELGLFAADIPIAYFEDSDLALRYRQAGFEATFVDIEHDHRRSSSMQVIPRERLEAIRLTNQVRFLGRWSKYLKDRKLRQGILIDLVSAGWGDIVCSLPAVLQLREDHPRSHLRIRLSQAKLKWLFEPIPNSTVELINQKSPHEANLTWDPESARYDRAWNLESVVYSHRLYLGREIAASLGVEFSPERGRKWLLEQLSKLSPPPGIPRGKLAVIHAEYLRTGWEGRGVSPEHFVEAARELQKRGYFIALVGVLSQDESSLELSKICNLDLRGKITLEQLAWVISQSNLFVGFDSGPLHFAQILDIPTFAIFGATLPTSRLLNLKESAGVLNEGLNCIGCYHTIKPQKFNYCIRRDQACVREWTPLAVHSKLCEFLDSGTLSFAIKAMEHDRRMAQFESERVYRLGSPEGEGVSELQHRLAIVQKELTKIHHSKAFKIGSLILHPFRKIKLWLENRT